MQGELTNRTADLLSPVYLCSVVQRCAVQYSAVQFSTVQCNVVQCSAVQCITAPLSPDLLRYLSRFLPVAAVGERRQQQEAGWGRWRGGTEYINGTCLFNCDRLIISLKFIFISKNHNISAIDIICSYKMYAMPLLKLY